jgi:hypothetical protein
MPCTRTGCHIFLETHDEYLWGDAYEVGDVAYFRLSFRSRQKINGMERVHYVVHDFDNWFNKGEDLGALRDSLLITNNFTRA